ncbi:MAG: hypothetical protein M3Z26_13150 [Bacteroidota bacterium]|nr:hypothetical protein [Bacteroidota bacterium]
MLRFITSLLLVCMAGSIYAQSTEKEKVAKAYYSGFEKHDWNKVVSQFAKGFNFTSPNNDDHIPVEKFKEKCFGTNKFFKKVIFIKTAESGNDLFLEVEIITTENKIVHNVDVFKFEGGKIKSIETFFGAGTKYPGNTQ